MAPTNDTLYWAWVESEAALVGSDGCTSVTGFHVACCWEHDLAFYYAADPRDAYRLWRMGVINYWPPATAITFDQANADFKKCHVQRSKLGAFWWLNPFNIVRWRGVVRLSRGAWDRHRQREQRERVGV